MPRKRVGRLPAVAPTRHALIGLVGAHDNKRLGFVAPAQLQKARPAYLRMHLAHRGAPAMTGKELEESVNVAAIRRTTKPRYARGGDHFQRVERTFDGATLD